MASYTRIYIIKGSFLPKNIFLNKRFYGIYLEKLFSFEIKKIKNNLILFIFKVNNIVE
jgi:hypothetical protein